MTPDQLFTALMIAAALTTLLALVAMCRYERDTVRAEADAIYGRRLREAAGSRAAIERAIVETATQRQLEERCARELEQALRYPRVVGNVTPFRIVERGRPIHFEPPSGGEAV